jgi:hypothetical protein
VLSVQHPVHVKNVYCRPRTDTVNSSKCFYGDTRTCFVIDHTVSSWLWHNMIGYIFEISLLSVRQCASLNVLVYVEMTMLGNSTRLRMHIVHMHSHPDCASLDVLVLCWDGNCGKSLCKMAPHQSLLVLLGRGSGVIALGASRFPFAALPRCPLLVVVVSRPEFLQIFPCPCCEFT